MSNQHDKILIIDFGSASDPIDRPPRATPVCLLKFIRTTSQTNSSATYGAKGIILSGGPSSVTEGDTPRAPQAVFELAYRFWAFATACKPWPNNSAAKWKLPSTGQTTRIWFAKIRARGHTKLFDGIQDETNEHGHGLLNVWMSHGDSVSRPARGFHADGRNRRLPNRRYGRRSASFLRVQFTRSHAHDSKAKRF